MGLNHNAPRGGHRSPRGLPAPGGKPAPAEVTTPPLPVPFKWAGAYCGYCGFCGYSWLLLLLFLLLCLLARLLAACLLACSLARLLAALRCADAQTHNLFVTANIAVGFWPDWVLWIARGVLHLIIQVYFLLGKSAKKLSSS